MKLTIYDHSRPPDGDAIRGSYSPAWLTEWIANKPEFVVLDCGHKTDVKIPNTILIGFPGGVRVECVPCGKFVNVKRHIKLLEFKGIAASKITEEPMF
jgi:hypothetical protein